MTLQWIPLDALEAHPENSNRMAPDLMAKLKAHIRRTGLYEPLVVRPLATAGAGVEDAAAGRLPADAEADYRPARYQILNGHHRAQVLRELGHTHARCDVWEVDDDEARLLLATLNRLEGRDDPSARAALVQRLARTRSLDALSRLLPEPTEALERLVSLASPPPAPLPAADAQPLLRPMTFFLTDEQHAAVTEALRKAAEPQSGCPSGDRPSRAETLERLALWYLEARGLR